MKYITMRITTLIAVLLVFPSIAFAQIDHDKTVKKLGVQSSVAYFNFNEGMSLNCLYGLIYFEITTDFGQAAYSTLLSAKISGRELSRIDYSQFAEGEKCTASLVELESP
jgi:hypothetical protein